MCIKDKKWLKRFCLALLGLCFYLFDNGTDTAVANRLIQNCHVRFGAHVLSLVYVLPGLLISINTMINDKNQNESCIFRVFTGFYRAVFLVPMTVFALAANLIKMNDEWLDKSKG